MNWLLIILMAVILFTNRYLFLAPSLPVKLPTMVREALTFSAPCILSAICGPIILMNGDSLRDFPANPYLWGAIFAVVISYLLRRFNTIYSVLVGMGGFYLINYVFI